MPTAGHTPGAPLRVLGVGSLGGALCGPLLSALVTPHVNNREDALRPRSGPAQASSRTLPRVLVQSGQAQRG